jgi:hypothetical protein
MPGLPPHLRVRVHQRRMSAYYRRKGSTGSETALGHSAAPEAAGPVWVCWSEC